MNSPIALLFLTTLVYTLVFTTNYSNAHTIQKRGFNLVPTLTVDVAPILSQLPDPFNMGSIKEYHFALGERFNLSCVIKHPSFRYHMTIKRRALLNNGTKAEPINLVATNSYDPNPSLDLNRLTTETDEYFGTYDPTARFFRVSVIIRKLQIADTGFYSCEYHNITKEIKMVVFKQAHSKDIEFPVNNVKSVALGTPVNIGCSVSDVYPAPRVSFVLPNGNTVTKINTTDLSPANKTVYMYSQISEMTFQPKYTDHNKNLTCSVFSIGSSNMTVEKQLLLNVEGFQLTENCDKYFTGGVNQNDVEFSCTYFANPKIEPEWTTEIVDLNKKAKKIAADLINVDSLPKVTSPSDIAKTFNEVKESAAKFLRISGSETDTSNYVSSLEDLGNGLYKSILRVKKVNMGDYKDYKLKFSHGDTKVTEHVVSLKKTGFNKKLESVGTGSGTFLSSSIVHSTLAIALTSLLIRLTR